MSEKLLGIIEEYANIPVDSGNEEAIRRIIENNVRNYVDKMWVDKLGNLYTLKIGTRPGRVLLAAHQDKVVGSNVMGMILDKDEYGYLFNTKTMVNKLFQILNKKQTFFINDEEVKGKIRFVGGFFSRLSKTMKARELKGNINWLYYLCSNEAEERKIGNNSYFNIGKTSFYPKFEDKMNELAEFLNKELRFVPSQDIEIPKKSELVSWSKFNVRNGITTGKLDDSLGLGILTYLNQRLNREEMPDLLTVYTVCEETGGKGSRYASRLIKKINMEPSRIIVIDTTAFGKLGQGPVIYKSCGEIGFDERFVENLENIAKDNEIKYKAIDPLTFNDSTIFAKKFRNVATLAVEIPIEDIHSAKETTTVEDIIQTYRLLEEYLKHGNTYKLDEVRNRKKKRKINVEEVFWRYLK